MLLVKITHQTNFSENEAYQYAAVRNILYRKGYATENLGKLRAISSILLRMVETIGW